MTIGEYVERRGLMLRYLAIALIAAAVVAIFVFPEYFGLITRWEEVFCFLPVLLLYGGVSFNEPMEDKVPTPV